LGGREANTHQHNILNVHLNIIMPPSKVTPSRQVSRPRTIISSINITTYRHLKYQHKSLTPVISKSRITNMGSCMLLLF